MTSDLLPRRRGLHRASARVGVLALFTGLLVGLLSGLIGPAAAIQPAAAAAPAAPASSAAGAATNGSISATVNASASTAVNGQASVLETRLVTAAPGLKQGCPGPDALCDLAGDVAGCATSPIDCAEDTGEALAEAILPILTDAALRETLRAHARKAAGRFNRTTLGEETRALYERALQAR